MRYYKIHLIILLFFLFVDCKIIAQVGGPFHFTLYFPDTLSHKVRGFCLWQWNEDTVKISSGNLPHIRGEADNNIMNSRVDNKRKRINGDCYSCNGMRLFATDKKDTMVIDFQHWPDPGLSMDSIVFMPGYFFYDWSADSACSNSYYGKGKPNRCYVLPEKINSAGLKKYIVPSYKELITQKNK
jgi:hypothetical protein